MAVTTKKTFNAVGSGGQGTTTFTPVGIELNNQDDLDVYVTKTTAGIAANNGLRIKHYNQSSSSNLDTNHQQVNDTTGLYFPALTHTGGTETLENYTISTDNNTIEFNSALPSGAVVSIERRTRDSSSDYTNFAGGSTIRHTDVNAAFDESNFTAQEARNKAFELEGILFDGEAKDTLDVDGLDLDDNEKIRFGTGNDAEIYHGGTNTRFKNDKGDLIISCGTDDIRLAAKDDIYLEVNATDSGATSTENGIIVHGNGGVKLHYDNVEKVRTSAEGAIIFGVLQADGLTVGDNEKILAGNSDDLEIYHSGSHSYVNNTGTGNLYLSSAANVVLENTSGENYFRGVANAQAELYYNNVVKFVTSNTGATVTGVLVSDGIDVGDNEKILAGNSDDLEIYHGTNSYVNNNTGHLYIQNIGSNDDSNIYIRARNEEHSIVCNDDGSVQLYYNGNEKLQTSANGVSVTGTVFADGVDVGDDERIRLGNGPDLQLYHSGSHSYIKDTGTGALYIDTNDIRIQNAAEDEDLIRAIQNSYVKLYYDGSEKLTTDSTGVIVTGKLRADSIDVADNEKILVGASDDLEIYHNGTNSYIDNNTGSLVIQSDTAIVLEATNGENYVKGTANGSVELYYDDSKKLETTSAGATVTGVANATTGFQVNGTALNLAHLANVHDATPSDGQVLKWINANSRWEPAQDSGAGGASLSDGVYGEITVASSGSSFTINDDVITGDNLANNLDIPDNNKIRFGTDNDLEIYHDGSNSYLSHNGTGDLFIDADGSQENINLRSKKNVNIYVEDKTELAVKCNESGSVELYYDAVKKFETTSTGIKSGSVYVANSRLLVGTDSNTGHFNWNSNLQVAGTDAQAGISIRRDSDNTSGANIIIGKSRGSLNGSTIVQDDDMLGQIYFVGADGSSTKTAASIASYVDGTPGSNDMPGRIVFKTTPDGSTSAAERMRITSAGDVNINNDSGKLQLGASQDLQIYHDGTNSYIKDNGTGSLIINGTGIEIKNANNDETMATFTRDAAVELYYNNLKTFETNYNGIQVFGPEGAGAIIQLSADEGDDDHDKWRLWSSASSSEFRLQNYNNGSSWETNIKTYGDGALELFYDGLKKVETNARGIFVSNTEDEDTVVEIKAGNEGNAAILKMTADQEDDNADRFRLYVPDSDGISIQGWNGSAWETYLKGKGDSVELYYNNDKVFNTTIDGVKVFGTQDSGAYLYMSADEGDDNADLWRLQAAASDGGFRIANYADGGWENNIACTGGSTGAVQLYYNNNLKFWTDTSGTETIGRSLWHYNADEDEGQVLVRAWGTATNNNRLWLATRDTSSSKYRFCVDGDGELRTNSAHFIGVQRSDADSPINHFNSGDRIRYSAFRGTSDNASYRSRMVVGTASADWDDYRVFYYVDAQDDVAVDYDQDQTLSFSGSGRGNFKSSVWAGRVESDEGTPNSIYAQAERGFAAFADDATDQTTCMARNVADGTHVYYSEVNNEANFSVAANGETKADNTDNLANADYAESFEWTDGNTSNQERRGMTVVLDGEKVKLATDSDNKDNIIGVVSPNPAVLGDSACLGWHGRYKKDIYGTPITKAYEWLVWKKEYTYVDGVKTLCAQPDPTNPKTLEPADVERVKVEDIEKFKAKNLIPDFAITNNIRYTSYAKDIDTTNYDPTRAYIPRKDRKEWDAIGMVGKLIVRRGQPVGTRWLLMKENIGTDTDGTVLDRYLVR